MGQKLVASFVLGIEGLIASLPSHAECQFSDQKKQQECLKQEQAAAQQKAAQQKAAEQQRQAEIQRQQQAAQQTAQKQAEVQRQLAAQQALQKQQAAKSAPTPALQTAPPKPVITTAKPSATPTPAPRVVAPAPVVTTTKPVVTPTTQTASPTPATTATPSVAPAPANLAQPPVRSVLACNLSVAGTTARMWGRMPNIRRCAGVAIPICSAPAKCVNMRKWLLLAAIIRVIDQITKVVIVQKFVLHETLYVASFFNWVRVHNPVAAFSIFADVGGWQRHCL